MVIYFTILPFYKLAISLFSHLTSLNFLYRRAPARGYDIEVEVPYWQLSTRKS
jgi:hypothetical protein